MYRALAMPRTALPTRETFSSLLSIISRIMFAAFIFLCLSGKRLKGFIFRCIDIKYPIHAGQPKKAHDAFLHDADHEIAVIADLFESRNNGAKSAAVDKVHFGKVENNPPVSRINPFVHFLFEFSCR